MSNLTKIEKLEMKGKIIKKFEDTLKDLRIIDKEIGKIEAEIEEIKETTKKEI